MKELDFDELDRAVNSLMSSAPKSADTPDGEPAEKVIDLGSSPSAAIPAAPPVSKPASTATSPVASPEPVSVSASQTTPSTSLPPRRGGRFMDVVHPSSDMKKPEPTRPSRQGITIAPRPTFDTPKADMPAPEDSKDSSSETVKDEPTVATASTSTVSPVEEHPAAKSEWPDPLDMAGYGHEKDAPLDDATSKEEEVYEPREETSPISSEQSADTPLTSPFLPDAKVEKRPLGGAEPTSAPASEEPDHAPVIAAADTAKTQDDPNDQLPALPKDVEPTLPEELHSDLVEVESDTTTSGTPKTDEGQAISGLPPEPAKEEEKPVPAGPTSIPQQYHEEPTSGDKNNGAIYDTDTYHQPLAHPAKKKSGWLWVLWIVIILLVGAGAGAALYFLHVF